MFLNKFSSSHISDYYLQGLKINDLKNLGSELKM